MRGIYYSVVILQSLQPGRLFGYLHERHGGFNAPPQFVGSSVVVDTRGQAIYSVIRHIYRPPSHAPDGKHSVQQHTPPQQRVPTSGNVHSLALCGTNIYVPLPITSVVLHPDQGKVYVPPPHSASATASEVNTGNNFDVGDSRRLDGGILHVGPNHAQEIPYLEVDGYI